MAVGSFSWCPVRMQTTRSLGAITPSSRSSLAPATLAALAGSQPRPFAPTWALASSICSSLTSRTTPSQHSRARRHFHKIHRTIDLDGAGNRRRAAVGRRRARRSNCRMIWSSGRPPFQRRPRCSYKFIQRVGPGRVDHGQARHAIDQPQLVQFVKRLAKRAAVAQVAARHDDPIRHLPIRVPSSTRYMIVFWPSRRNGLTLLTR